MSYRSRRRHPRVTPEDREEVLELLRDGMCSFPALCRHLGRTRYMKGRELTEQERKLKSPTASRAWTLVEVPGWDRGRVRRTLNSCQSKGLVRAEMMQRPRRSKHRASFKRPMRVYRLSRTAYFATESHGVLG